MRLHGQEKAHRYLCTMFTLLAVLPQQQSSTLGLPLSATALNPGAGQPTSTNQTEVQALHFISASLFQSSAQQIAYGWLPNMDPCGTATCTNQTSPPCIWTGLSCRGWHVTAIQLDPATITQPGMAAQLGGTISDYIYYLSRLTSLQLADQGLTGTVPRVLSQLRALQILDLSSNALTGFLPNTFGLLTNLTTLRLNNNSLGGQVPPVWSGMTSLTTLDLSNNSAICNPLPSIPQLVNPTTQTITNPTLQFPPCNASILAAQTAAAEDASPSPTTSTSPSPAPAAGPPVSQYRMSQGINVSVSVLVGICFLLGLCAGVVRIRQQRRNHQRLLAGLNRARRNQHDPTFSPGLTAENPDGVWYDLAPYSAADSPYCSTPRLVLGPDGQHLALARKLKQQSAEGPDQAAGQQAPNCGQESNPSAAESVNSPSSMGHPRMHVNLYIAELDVDALESAAPAAPLDLVSPSEAAAAPVASTSARAAAADTVPPSHSQGGTLTNISADGSNSRQASSLGLASTPANPASEGNGFVSRISQRLSGLISSQAAQSHANQQALSQVQLPGQDLEANSAADGGSRTGVPQQSSSASVQEQARLGVSPSRSWWPFSRAA